MGTSSTNFGFLVEHHPRLVMLGSQAELLFHVDPPASITKVRLLAEDLAQLAAARAGLFVDRREAQVDLLRRLRDKGLVTADVHDAFHAIRKAGNAAAHDNAGTSGEALSQLRLAFVVSVWFHRTFSKDRLTFKQPAFVVPRPPEDAAARLRAELSALKNALAVANATVTATKQTAEQAKAAREALEEQLRAELDDAKKKALEADEARLAAEAKAQLEESERLAAMALLDEVAAREAALAADLAKLQVASLAAPELTAAFVTAANDVTATLDLDEATTRRLVDEKLREAGWEVDSQTLRHALGARPQKGRYLAIAEWPTESGPADYVLFAGLVPLAIVEAKRSKKNVPAVLQQAARYAKDLLELEGLDIPRAADGEPGFPEASPPQTSAKKAKAEHGRFLVPFLFATNGRAYLAQIKEASGIWFRDARRPENLARALDGWHSPQGLLGLLGQDIAAANEKLEREETDYLGLRPYQVRAIRAAEAAIAEGAQTALLAMATGTGKTRTCIGLCYRLLKTGRFRRILFLADRTALTTQTEDAFQEARLEQLTTFAQSYQVKGPKTPEVSVGDTKLHIATVQSLVRGLLYGPDDTPPPPVDTYDCIVVDECHRGYTLDRELSEGELLFRDESDYLSKYRRVLEHFDAVKIALTATPALHTRQIFGDPVYTYSYREAVIDGFLVDHSPPTRIVTALAEDGITFKTGEKVPVYQPRTQTQQLALLPDEIQLEIDQFHRKVITRPFNEAVAHELAKHIDPSLPGKTLVFCVNDLHADMVVDCLKQAFVARYGSVEDGAVEKITGSVDRPLEAIRRYRTDRRPCVAVTVDLLTTGVDVPEIDKLVFLRRVRSRILYEQMLGRATRLCPDLHGAGRPKEVFQIFDAVDLYAALANATDMKPVVVDPSLRFKDLVEDLKRLKDAAHIEHVLGELVTKLARKVRRLDARIAERLADELGQSPEDLVRTLRSASPTDARKLWLDHHPHLADLLDARPAGDGIDGLYVSHHADEVRRVEQGYGPGRQRPEDYLDGFAKYVREHLNDLPALVVVTQRPKDLTRAQLKELRLALDKAGYPESHLRAAWAQRTNQDIAASILGHIRQAALGDPLIDYDERVNRALKKILASRPWDPTQKKWLERLAKQLQKEIVVDRESLDAEGSLFAAEGGSKRLEKVFEGRLGEVLSNLSEAAWREGA
ncbi:MAG: type I restriction-modification system endonuclease [Sandaracinaceae bacterium]|nr:type I restriction-modification system endonuclease [Sandaracinaceae bacterium]